MSPSPDQADTDGDGIYDGEELIYWDADWNADQDGDGLNNLQDHDSDGDGYSDSQEIIDGYEPSNSNSKPEYAKIWIEAENGSHTKKKPGIVLILETIKDRQYWIRLISTIQHFDLPIDTWSTGRGSY